MHNLIVDRTLRKDMFDDVPAAADVGRVSETWKVEGDKLITGRNLAPNPGDAARRRLGARGFIRHQR